MAKIILLILKNDLVEQMLPSPKPDMENESGMINLPNVIEQCLADSKPVNSKA